MSDNVPFSSNSVLTSAEFNNTLQEVNNLYDFLKLEFKKYTHNQILFDAIEDCMRSDSCDYVLKKKVINKFMSNSCSQCTDISNGQMSSISLLGTNAIEEQLTYSETIKLKNMVTNNLKTKYETVCKQFHKFAGKSIEEIVENIKDSEITELSAEDKALLEYKQELTTQQNKYIENLLAQLELLQEITRLRVDVLPDITQEKIKECEVQAKMNLLRSRIAEEKVRIDIFTETNKSLNAYKELISDIQGQETELKKEIEALQDMKEKYKSVACKQYDEVLKSFLQYKMSIEKKKLLYECIKS